MNKCPKCGDTEKQKTAVRTIHEGVEKVKVLCQNCEPNHLYEEKPKNIRPPLV